MASNEQIAYLAGLMDGEGTWSIQVNVREYKGVESAHFNPRMTMTLKYGNEVLDELVNVFGGAIYNYDDRQMRRWSMGKRVQLIDATNQLLPFLRIKKDIASRFLDAMSVFPASRKAHGSGERSWTPEMTEYVARIALTLNPERSRKSEKTLSYLEKLDGIYGVETNVDAIIKSTERDET